ncbi:unnamed protein product [Porites lobata]|uniref:Uncharacterized protein n=1 Tax=Porites lobata TaxID=104759 RepID=A0ABN8SEH3_9CNID|nr:unnamed protein product [Porites lobata]
MRKSGVFQPTSTSGSFMFPRFGREKNCRDAITQRPFYQSLQRFQDKEYSTTMCLNWGSQCCVIDDGGSFMHYRSQCFHVR